MKPLHEVRSDLDRVVKKFPGSFDLTKLEEAALSGEIQVFPLRRATIVGQAYSDGTVRIIAAGGNMADILEFEPELRRWYKAAGCDRMILYGRAGWRRILAERGWRSGTDGSNQLIVELR